ncbi:MAG: hypothetical protein CMN28_10470 [Salinisphaeraceae bacterium]|nr:hypothetical protein [Salinisphaeraceae bacterium]
MARDKLWEHYVFRRGAEVDELWEDLYEDREIDLIYIAGSGFDVRAQIVANSYTRAIQDVAKKIVRSKLILIQFNNYQLPVDLEQLSTENGNALEGRFSVIGEVKKIPYKASDEEETSASLVLREVTSEILACIEDPTDIVLDASSLPRVVYLALMTSILNRLIPDKDVNNPLAAGNINFQVIVAEDAALDSNIVAEDPSSEIVHIPGFRGAMQAESVQDWPLVWFPILGENRGSQLQQILNSTQIPKEAEICPVLPNPSRNPRRSDELLTEYRQWLFESGRTPTSNIIFVHESQPFEVYRQLLGAMQRFRESLEILGGCRLFVTPLGSKLITIGAGLACFEMRPQDLEGTYGVAIPHAEPTRYNARREMIVNSVPEICCLLVTGEAYA